MPFAVPTTTSTSSVTIYPVDESSQAVASGCGAVGRLASGFMRDESSGVRVTSSASRGLNEIEMIEEAPAVLPKYSAIVSAAKDFSATLQQNVGSQRWRSVTRALNALSVQCQAFTLMK